MYKEFLDYFKLVLGKQNPSDHKCSRALGIGRKWFFGRMRDKYAIHKTPKLASAENQESDDYCLTGD